VTAPPKLCLFDARDQVLEFWSVLRAQLARRHTRVWVDLRYVQSITIDGLLIVRAALDDAIEQGRGGGVRGNLPNDIAVAATLKASGFFQGFVRPPGQLPAPQGLVRRWSSTQVQSKVAAELVEFAMENADVPRHLAAASYKALVELMSNTHLHSGEFIERRQRRKPGRWFASVQCREQVAEFAFLDLGIGILQSPAARSFLRRAGDTLIGYGEEVLLKDVFEGRVGASIEQPGRGFGLGRLRQMARDGLLGNLRVMTKSVAGRVDALDFTEMSQSLRGTAYHWTTKQGQ